MNVLEVAIWSAAAGAMMLVVLFSLADFARMRTVGAAQGVIYNTVTLLFVTFMSGLPRLMWPGLDPKVMHVAQVVLGPLCVCFGDLWVRGWLSARHRDRLMDGCLLGAGTLLPVAGLACVALPQTQQLPAAAGLVLVNTGIVIWMCARAWLLGDSLALGMAIGSLFMLPAVGGLYAVALGLPGLHAGWQAAIALASVLCITVVGVTLWKRNQHARRTHGHEPLSSEFDPVTRLPGGLAFVRALVRAQARRRRTQRDGAVVSVILFEPDRILAQAGTTGLHEAYQHIAQRLQRQVGVVNPVGRYWDRCFMALAETVHSPAALRTLGLRVATSLRRPVTVTGANGEGVHLRLDVGVGVVHLNRDLEEVEDVLHEAQRLAEAARAMPSRAAARDPASGDMVPVEHAQLGRRRAGRYGVPSGPVLPAGGRAQARA